MLARLKSNAFWRSRAQIVVCLLVIAATGLLIYRNAYGVPFLFDDFSQIVLNPRIRSLEWPWQFLENNRRPVLYASLAVNAQQFGLNPRGFHFFNILVHIAAGMTLFLLVYSTCRMRRVRGDFRQDALMVALGVCLLWLCHPMQTQAVTYIIQRAESMMALFFLICLYSSSRYFITGKAGWLTAAVLTSLLCGLTKEVALALPVVVLLYDRAFVCGSFREAIVKHRWLYAWQCVTWAVMLYLYFTTNPEKVPTAGFQMQGMTPWEYASNQPRVVLHYLRLAAWPDALVFDYQWPVLKDISLLLPSIALISAALVLLFVFRRRYPVISFLGLSFFVILAPSSSFIPLKDLAYEYRMYLPLSCLSVLWVCALKVMIDRFSDWKYRRAVFGAVVCGLALLFSGLTYQRNLVYQSEETLWRDVVAKQPSNFRIWSNLGTSLFMRDQFREAEQYFGRAFELNPRSAEVATNLAMALASQGRHQEALVYAQRAVELDPEFASGYSNLGVLLLHAKRYQEAADYCQKALQLGFVQPAVLKTLGIALSNLGRVPEALQVLTRAQRLDPQSVSIRKALNAVIKKTQSNEILNTPGSRP